MFKSQTDISVEALLEAALKNGDENLSIEYLCKKPTISNKHYYACGVGFVNSNKWVIMMEQLGMMQHRLRGANKPVPVTHSSKFLDLPTNDTRLIIFRNIMSFANKKYQTPSLLNITTIEKYAKIASQFESCPFYFYACGLLSTFPELKEFSDSLFSTFNAISYNATESVLNSWRTSFTDPSKHDDANFVYLVTAVRSDQTRDIVISKKKEIGEYDPSQVINRRKNPDQLFKKKFISASVVSNNRPYIFATPGSSSGLIISCPVENILLASSRDLFTSDTAVRNELLKNRKPINVTVQDLLADKTTNINDILICGSSEFGQVKVIGFFDLPGDVSGFKAKAEEMNLPLIRYPWKQGEIEVAAEANLALLRKYKQDSLAPVPAQEQEVQKYVPGVPAFKPGFLSASNTPKNNSSTEPKDEKPSTAKQGIFGFQQGFLLKIKPKGQKSTPDTVVDNPFRK